MKTNTHPMLAVALTLMAFVIHAGAKGQTELPVGEWTVTFHNGVVESLDIAADGTAKVSQAERIAAGKATLKDGIVEIVFEDDRLERWSLRGGEMVVEHLYPIAGKPGGKPIMGIAQKRDEVVDLEVHEWGTFTVLLGSNGQVINWYQAPDKLIDLPSFVQRTTFWGIAGKSGTAQRSSGVGGRSGTARLARIGVGLDNLRMETPVLYFYPEEKMDITVRAEFPAGRISEAFPPVAINQQSRVTWRGTLLPPNSPELKKVPPAADSRGRHYAAARAVPEAWLFRNKPMPPPFSVTAATVTAPTQATAAYKKYTARQSLIKLITNATKAANAPPAPPKIEPIDHFIFYRGAGNIKYFQITARQLGSHNQFQLTNNGRATIPKLFALQVVDGKSSWLAIDQLKTVNYKKGEERNQPTITFPAPRGKAREVAAELRTEMIAALHSEGLTMAEAAAMVATWDDLWFTDPGTRILAVLPQSFAEQMVPLTITPRPKKIERVFVARLELLTRETEAVLLEVLNPIGAKDESLFGDATKLASLQLGRYAAGGMERARNQLGNQLAMRFHRLELELKKREFQAAAAIKTVEK